MIATLIPVDPATDITPSWPTPASVKAARITSAAASLPTRPSISTETPMRAAATAWLPPLPPKR
ncbi:MAG: hypothetical protein AAGP08_09160 [Pseudomonadota bacterium]